MNWTINNNTVKSLTHNDKEIILIVRDDDNTIIYQNTNTEPNLGDYIELTVNGNTVTPYSHYEQLSGDGDIYIDWGDGTPLEKYNDWDVNTYRDFTHNYQSTDIYSVKIYGVKEIGDGAFDDVTTIVSVTLPETITSIGNDVFDHTQIKSIDIPKSVTSLGSFDFITLDTIAFNWDTQNTILPYDSDWNLSNVGDPYIIVPQGTTQLYVDAGYPIAKLKESYLLLDSDKSILSYSDSETATLTAQILTNNNIDISGQKIKFEGIENTVLENHSITNSPDTNTYSLSDFWMLDATVNNSSQIDIYRSSNAYIRIRKTSDGYRIRQSDSPLDVTLNGSVLYCDNNLFYTDEDDTLDLTSYSSTYNTIKFMVYVTINKLISYGMGVTNSNGIATCTYSSTGVGDVSFCAKSGSLVSEQYTIHDTWYHTTTIPANTATDIGNGYMKSIFNNPIALPSSFSIDMLVNSSSSDAASMGTLMLGETSSDFYYHGVMNTNLLACISRNNSRVVLQPSGNNIPKNSDVIITIQYNNGVHTIKYKNASISVNNNEYTMDYFLGLLYRGVTYKEITINQIKPLHSISLSADNSILSYADSDSATLTATFSKGSGYDVKLYDASDDSVVGTMTDNNDGTYTYEYESGGIGDISFYAKSGSLVSESYTVEDCLYFDSQTTDKSRYAVQTGGATISYGSNGVTITGTQATDTLVKNTALTLPSEYSAEVTLTQLSGEYVSSLHRSLYGGLCFDNCLIDMSSDRMDIYTLSPIASLTTIYEIVSVGDVLKIEMNNGTMKIYKNNSLLTTQSIASTGVYQHRVYKGGTNVGRGVTAKDLKVKPL